MLSIIPVAGQGSRMSRLTKLYPKELLPLADRPVLDHILSELEDAGIERTVLVSRPDKPLIAQYATARGFPNPKAMTVEVVHQDARPGNGGAILSGAEAVGDEPVLVVWGDEVFIPGTRTAEVLSAFASTGKPTISLSRVDELSVRKCGIAEVEDGPAPLTRVRAVLEKPSPMDTTSRLASVGGFALTSELLHTLSKTPPSADGEIYLSTAIDNYAREHSVYGVELSSAWYETGSIDGYIAAFQAVVNVSM
ncbi:UTP--glucose-1-phosphate uridylyltransferase [Arthrobacter sp. NicSoilE8]|nr:UTP--glucose-1-phosphate uridylyltransferase [Arthrobacter sp. NicSoilE8]